MEFIFWLYLPLFDFINLGLEAGNPALHPRCLALAVARRATNLQRFADPIFLTFGRWS
jgi:hypothetical protein